jgi:hypothetical protein
VIDAADLVHRQRDGLSELFKVLRSKPALEALYDAAYHALVIARR